MQEFIFALIIGFLICLFIVWPLLMFIFLLIDAFFDWLEQNENTAKHRYYFLIAWFSFWLGDLVSKTSWLYCRLMQDSYLLDEKYNFGLWNDICEVNTLSSRMCEKGTKGCIKNHRHKQTD